MKWYIVLSCVFNLLPVLSQEEKRNWVVVIDPGHGGKDPGAMGSELKEKDVVLAIALKLKKHLQHLPHTTVILTREKDVFIPLTDRANIANKNRANLFISLHCNASKNKEAYGTEVYVMGMSKMDENLEVAMKENAVATLEHNYLTTYSIDPNSPEAYIIFSHLQNKYLEKSLQAAYFIHKNLTEGLQFNPRGVHQAPFFVLWKTTMPSVLVEIAYISNKKDEKRLKADSVQEKIARAIYDAVVEYRQKVEKIEEFVSSADVSSSGQVSIVYKVQFGSFLQTKDFSSKEFAFLQPITSEKQGKYYVYFSGEFSSKEEAVKHKEFLVNHGYKDAFVVSRKKQ